MSNKNDNTSLYEQQEELIRNQSTEFIAMLTKRGFLGDQRINDEKIRNAKKSKQKNSYHNTLLLLKNYRTIEWLLECFPDEIAEELECPLGNLDILLDHIDMEISMNNQKLESRMEGVRKSRILIDRVNEALTVLKKKPENGEILYRVIYETYITPEKIDLTGILYRLSMSQRHYYRLRSQAITIISLRLWSAPAKDVDFWLDILTLLEGLNS